MISINGIPKPSFRAFELLATAGNYSLPTSITDDAALGTVSAFATTSNAQNQHSTLQVFLSNFSGKRFLTHLCTHAWLRLYST